MSSRKDIIKRSLGITEYPWSSDDELEEVPVPPEDGIAQRPTTEPQAQPSTTDAPGPSGISGPSQAQEHFREIAQLQLRAQQHELQAASRRHQARQERNLFWSIINSPHRISNVNQNLRSRSNEAGSSRAPHVPAAAQELWPGLVARRPDLQRLSDFKRITIDLRKRNHARPPPRANPGVIVPSAADSNSGIIINRRRVVRPAATSANASSRTTPAVSSWEQMGGESSGGSGRERDRDRERPCLSPPESSLSRLLTLNRRILRAARNTRASPDGQPEPAPAPAPLLNADEVNNNPSTSTPAEPEIILDEGNDELMMDRSVSEMLGVETMELPNINVSLEEEIVAIDLDNSDAAPAPVTNETNTSPPAAGTDRTDGRFDADPHRNATSGDASTSSNANGNSEPCPEPIQRREESTRRDSSEFAEPQTVKEFNQNLLRLLECPVCLEWMEPPMSQCRRGHLVCGVCRARLASCPVCRTTFSSVRNRAMEGVAEMLRYPCRHGCGRQVRLRRRAPHEASCAARKYQCPAPPCAAREPMPLSGLAQHFQSQHLTMIKVGSQHKFSIKMNSELHDNWLIMAMEQYFHLKVDVDARTWGVVVYVSFIGPMCDAKNYTYEVTIDGRRNNLKLVYVRNTHSDLESSTLNLCRQDCFHLSHEAALNYARGKKRRADGDKFLHLSLQLARVERTDAIDDSDS